MKHSAGAAATVAQARQRFYDLATQAIADGQLTAEEMDAIARPGTRKAGIWVRHLHALTGVLAERRARQATTDDTD